MWHKLSNHTRSFIILSVWVTVVHFLDGQWRLRDFIGYDDHIFIEPMLNLSWQQYWDTWFPNRSNFAFPLRDLFFLIEKHCSELIGFSFYLYAQFAIFLFSSYWITKTFFSVLTNHIYAFFASAIFMLHPLQVESLQWVSVQKHVLAIAFLSPAIFLSLRSFFNRAPLSTKQWWMVFACYFLSINCWPTAILFPIWIMITQLQMPQGRSRLSVVWSLVFFTLLFAYWRFVTSGATDYTHSASRLGSSFDFEKAFYFLSVSSGRAFFNFLFPYRLAPYYDEASVLNYWGLSFLILAIGLSVWRLRFLRRQLPAQWRNAIGVLAFAALFHLPQMMVYLTFAEFVWADRYFYGVLPFLTLFFAVLITGKVILASPTKQLVAMTLVSVWILLACFFTIERVPLWRDYQSLAVDCSRHEASPKCMIQAVQQTFNNGGCRAASEHLQTATIRFQTNKPKYSVEFNSEVPFYGGLCIAMLTSLKPSEKLARLPQLFDVFGGSGEIIFSLVLANLEAGRVQEAMKLAESYYLNDTADIGIAVTHTLINIYRGQIKALCELLPSPSCEKKKAHFEYLHELVQFENEKFQWGYMVTKTLWDRSKGSN